MCDIFPMHEKLNKGRHLLFCFNSLCGPQVEAQLERSTQQLDQLKKEVCNLFRANMIHMKE